MELLEIILDVAREQSLVLCCLGAYRGARLGILACNRAHSEEIILSFHLVAKTRCRFDALHVFGRRRNRFELQPHGRKRLLRFCKKGFVIPLENFEKFAVFVGIVALGNASFEIFLVGLNFDKRIKSGDIAFQILFFSRLREYVGKFAKSLVAVCGVGGNHVVKRLVHIRGVPRFVKHLEGWGYAEFVEVLSYERLTKGVYGADMAKRQFVYFVSESVALFARGRTRRLEKFLMQSFLEFVRGGVVVHQNEQILQRRTLGYHHDYALDHSRGFARACRRRNENTSSLEHGFFLVVGEKNIAFLVTEYFKFTLCVLAERRYGIVTHLYPPSRRVQNSPSLSLWALFFRIFLCRRICSQSRISCTYP